MPLKVFKVSFERFLQFLLFFVTFHIQIDVTRYKMQFSKDRKVLSTTIWLHVKLNNTIKRLLLNQEAFYITVGGFRPSLLWRIVLIQPQEMVFEHEQPIKIIHILSGHWKILLMVQTCCCAFLATKPKSVRAVLHSPEIPGGEQNSVFH